MRLRFGRALLAIMLLPHAGRTAGVGRKARCPAAGIRHRRSEADWDQLEPTRRLICAGVTAEVVLRGEGGNRNTQLLSIASSADRTVKDC
jgi:hypothetical protein